MRDLQFTFSNTIRYVSWMEIGVLQGLVLGTILFSNRVGTPLLQGQAESWGSLA